MSVITISKKDLQKLYNTFSFIIDENTKFTYDFKQVVKKDFINYGSE
jgi:hypothetical protein